MKQVKQISEEEVVKRFQDAQKCKHCRGDIKIRNPKGNCDHLKYPENCIVCKPPTEKELLIKELRRIKKSIVYSLYSWDQIALQLEKVIKKLEQ